MLTVGAGLLGELSAAQGAKIIVDMGLSAMLLFGVYVELTIVVAVALLFSSFSTPALSALLTFFVFVIGHFSAELKNLAAPGGARLLFAALYYILPNLSNYAYINAASHGQTPAPENFTGALLYGLAYVAVLLAASTLIFRRRNFK